MIQEYFSAFKAQLAAQGSALPEYVEQAFENYLKCGRDRVRDRVTGTGSGFGIGLL